MTLDNTGRTGHQRYVAFRTIRERITEEIGGSVVVVAGRHGIAASQISNIDTKVFLKNDKYDIYF